LMQQNQGTKPIDTFDNMLWCGQNINTVCTQSDYDTEVQKPIDNKRLVY